MAIPHPRLVTHSRNRLFFITGEYRRHGAKDDRPRHEFAVASPASDGHVARDDRIDVASHLRGLPVLPFGTFAKAIYLECLYLFRCEKSKIVGLRRTSGQATGIHHSSLTGSVPRLSTPRCQVPRNPARQLRVMAARARPLLK